MSTFTKKGAGLGFRQRSFSRGQRSLTSNIVENTYQMKGNAILNMEGDVHLANKRLFMTCITFLEHYRALSDRCMYL